MFPQSFLEALRTRICLSQLIQEAQIHLVNKGRYFVGLCPFHAEKTPSFTVHDQKGNFHCFGCGIRGDAIDFIRQHEGVRFEEAVKSLALQAGLSLPEPTTGLLDSFKPDQQVDLEALEMAAEWFQSQMPPQALSYLALRSISPEQQTQFRLGWAPYGSLFIQKALAQGHSLETLDRVGLVRRSASGHMLSFFQNRLIFPIFNAKAQVIGFGGRTLGSEQPKYLNSPQTPIFHKAKAFYHRPKSVPARAKILVVEGYFDVIATCQKEIFSCAPLGTALNPKHLQSLWRKTDDPIICMDGDRAGRAAQWNIATMALPFLTAGKNLLFITLPQGHDPHSFVQAYGHDAFLTLIHQATPLSNYIWDSLFKTCVTPEDKGKAMAQWRNLVGTLKDPSLQAFFQEYALEQRQTSRNRPFISRACVLPPIPGEAFYHKVLLGMLFLEPDLIQDVREPLMAMTLTPQSSWWHVRQKLLLWDNGEASKKCFEDMASTQKDFSGLSAHIPRGKDQRLAYWIELFNAYETYIHQKKDVDRLKKDLFRTPQAWEQLKILTQL